jgi:hypothetical protein
VAKANRFAKGKPQGARKKVDESHDARRQPSLCFLPFALCLSLFAFNPRTPR